MAKTIVIASGKGGTGKTMFTANIGATLSTLNKRVCLIDMDCGLRNLDLYLGLENNVVYDVMDILNGVCRIKQALIKDREFPNMYFIAASPKADDEEITPLHMKVLCDKLKNVFDYIIIDAPAGFNDSVQIALGGADAVILVITPEYASIRDAEVVSSNLDKQGIRSVYYVLNKVNVDLIQRDLAPDINEIPSAIRDRVIGVIQEDENIHISTNVGMPMVYMEESYVKKNFERIAHRVLKL